MLITFIPTGETVFVPPNAPVKGPILTPGGIPYVETAEGTTPVEGTIVSGGSVLFPLGGAKYGLSFIREDGTTYTVFNLESEDAVDTAKTTIDDALNADTEAIGLNADGTLGS